ncbi:MAG: hypothetical protein IJD05_08210 [Bacteroidaceae bacterium]|nr:hypothetical protein [Bacteroidaceae bacterium]
MGLTDFISLVALYVEIGVLAYCDWKMWRTMYTPLNMLMLPYAFMLTVTLLFCGNFGVAEFYYPSLLVWMVGLVIFAIPSFVFGLAFRDKIRAENGGVIKDNVNMNVLTAFTTVVVMAFILRFVSMVGSSPYLPGTEDFGYDYCGGGFWGHLHRALHALSIIYIYKIDKKHWYYLFLIMGMFFVTLMYGVKSWVLIPAMAGFCMRLFSGKMQLKAGLVIKVLLFSFIVFFVTYSFALVLGQEEVATFDVIFEIIYRNFAHYVISGILGWSQDLQMGILEQGNFDVLLVNVLNLIYVVTGDEFVSPINPFFIYNGINGSNVRAFFGTIYIHTTAVQFVMVVTVVSSIYYIVKLLALKTRGFFVNLVYYFYLGMLCMGWFEIYFYHLQFFEVPAWIFILYMIAGKRIDETEDTCKGEIAGK